MGIEQLLVRKLQELPPSLQLHVLDFIEQLRKVSRPDTTPRSARHSLKGLWADRGADISDDDISELRREMWRDFPRGDA